MEKQTVQAALISTDAAFRETVREAAVATEGSIRIAAEIEVPIQEIGTEHVAPMRELNPDLVFLDLGADPGIGIRFARFLADANPSRRVIAAGPTLAPDALIAAMQAGISEYLPKPVTVEAMTEALERAERKLGLTSRAGARQPGQILSFYSAKGGSGCTTLATNVAIHLHRLTGKKTLIVDLDPELGEVALFFGVQPRFNFVDMIRNFHRMDAELLTSFIEKHESGVHLLSAPYVPERSEVVSGEQIQKILGFLRHHYEYVIVDSCKSLTPPTLAHLAEADHIYLITNVDLPSLRNIKRCLPVLQSLSRQSGDKIRLVINRYHAGSPISLDEVESTLGLKAYRTLCNDYETVIEAINSGRPVALTGGRSAFAGQLKEMGAEIAGLSESKRKPSKRLRIPFGRALFSLAGGEA